MNKQRWLPFVCLISIIFIAGFLRLYKIEDYMGFLGDEGRDALIVKRMIIDKKFTLLGPITSVGLMHLGPMYYYIMAPFLIITKLNPVGPAIMVALFSLGTIFLIWKLVSEFYSKKAAFFACLLYGLAPLVIIHSHSSWNPNILPFFSTLIIYSLLKAKSTRQILWILIAGMSFGIAIQLHYVALVFIPIIFASLVLLKSFNLRNIFLGISGFILLFSPFLIFEIRHEFINTRTIFEFATRTGNEQTFGITSPFMKFWDLSVRLVWRLLTIENAEIAKLFLFVLIGFSLYLLRKDINSVQRKFIKILLIWYGVGIGVLSFYTGSIYDYYLMFIFPLPFILIGIFLSNISKSFTGKIVSFSLIIYLIFVYMKNTSILQSPNRLVAQTKHIADFVLSKTDNNPYNFALIAGKNSDHAYRYFLDIDGLPPTVIENTIDDPKRNTVTKQLFVVCEEEVCAPLGHPLWEIAGFGRAEISEMWRVGLFQVFKLIPYLDTNL